MKTRAKNSEEKHLFRLNKKIILILLILLLSLVVALIVNTVKAGTFDITLTQLSGDSYPQGAVNISWPTYDFRDKNFKIYRSNDGTNFETVGLDYTSVTDVRLLQIYPIADAANQMKNWIVDSGYGKGIIRVNSVSIEDFNANAATILKTNDNWNYDVLFFGTWDCNADKDLTEASRNAVLEFIRAGKGSIFGHDTIVNNWFNHPYFRSLAPYVGVKIVDDCIALNATDKVTIIKKGLFTTYPNYIGDVGKVLTIPVAHSIGQVVTTGTSWLEFQSAGSTMSNGEIAPSFLTTYNNCAMIQTGHSSGAATSDEMKIIANIVFYCNQLLFNKNQMNDAAAIDVAAPDAPYIQFSDNAMSFTSTDNGSTYTYYVKSFSKNDTSDAGVLDTSTRKSITVTSGLANYRYIYDNNPNTVVTLSSNTSTGRVPLDTTVRYLHVAAVDNAGNIGPTSTVKVVPYKVNHYKQNLDMSTYTLVNGDSYTAWGFAGTVVHPDVKMYDGYNSPAAQSATISENENTVINYYYTRRTDLTYNVNYLEYGSNQVLSPMKTVPNRTFGETINSVNDKIDVYGYKYYSVSPAYLTITTGNNVINVYYQKRSDLKYTVRYKDKETNEEIHSPKVVENQTYLAVINPEDDKIAISGYVFDSIVPQSFSISVDESLNIVDILYTKKKDISYQVNYLDVDTNQVIHPTEVVSGQTYNSVINGEMYKIGIDGYEYNSINPSVLILGADSSYNVMNVYYRKRPDLTYTVNYYLENTVTKLHESKVATNQTFGDKVYTDNEIITINGYNFVRASTDSITIQSDNTRNVINIYYKEQSGVQYTVNYYLRGTSTRIKKSRVVSSQFGDEVEALDEKADIPGYNYSYASPMVLRVTNNNDSNVINIYYERRTDLEYTVEYLIKDSPHVMIQQSKNVKNKTLGDTVNASSEVIGIEGFIYSTAHPSVLTIGPNNEENILSLYYTRRPDLSYTVNYLDNSTMDKIKTSKVVTGIDFEKEIFSSYEVINIDGYEYVNADVNSIIVGVNESQNVINLYYQRLNNLTYRVNYIDSNTGDMLRQQKVVGNQLYGAQVNSAREMVDIPGYNFTSASPSTLIIGTGDNIINLYYTARNDLYYTVNYFIKDTRIKIQQSKVVRNQTYGSSVLADSEIVEVDKYRYVGKDKEILTIDSEVRNNYINLYYSRISNVNIKYLDKYSGQELATTNTITGFVGDEYNAGPYYQELEGYELIERPESLTGVYTNEDINLCFYYAKVVSVISKYLDKYTGEPVFEQSTQVGYVGKEYQTYMVTIPGYRYIDKNGNETGRMIDGTIVVTYYYSKESSVTVIQRDPSTNEIIGQYTIDGYEGMPYTVEEPEVDGYTFVKSEGQTQGTIPKEGNVVTLYYAKNANLTVRYKNYYTGEEIDTPTVTQEYEGKQYTTSRKNIEGWTYLSSSDNTVGYVERNGTEVTYYYAKSTTIKVNYVDATTGNELANSRTIEGYVGQEYSVNPISINGYVYSESTGDSSTGQMAERQLRITFKYLKATGLIVKYVDLNNEEEISEEKYFEGYSSHEYDVTDERKDIDGYTYIRDSGNTRGIFQNPVTEVIYYYAKTSKITVKYVDLNTHEEIAQESVYNGYEGKSVSILPKEINEYTKVRSDKDVPSEIGREEETITFYYVKDSTITIKYVDYNSKEEIANRVVLNGYEGKSYDLSSYNKSINNYYLLYEPAHMRGEFARENITVTFYYGKETRLVIKYVDRNTKEEISDRRVTKHHSGETYNLREYEKDVTGYLLMDKPKEEGVIMDEDLVLTFYYAKKVKITVVIKDPDTGEVIEEKEIEGHEGKDYEIVIDKIDGYEFDGSNAPTSGTMTHDNGVIELYYKKVKEKEKEPEKEKEQDVVNPETEDETTAPVVLPQTGETIYIVVAIVIGVTVFGIFAFIKQKED